MLIHHLNYIENQTLPHTICITLSKPLRLSFPQFQNCVRPSSRPFKWKESVKIMGALTVRQLFILALCKHALAGRHYLYLSECLMLLSTFLPFSLSVWCCDLRFCQSFSLVWSTVHEESSLSSPLTLGRLLSLRPTSLPSGSSQAGPLYTCDCLNWTITLVSRAHMEASSMTVVGHLINLHLILPSLETWRVSAAGGIASNPRSTCQEEDAKWSDLQSPWAFSCLMGIDSSELRNKTVHGSLNCCFSSLYFWPSVMAHTCNYTPGITHL